MIQKRVKSVEKLRLLLGLLLLRHLCFAPDLASCFQTVDVARTPPRRWSFHNAPPPTTTATNIFVVGTWRLAAAATRTTSSAKNAAALHMMKTVDSNSNNNKRLSHAMLMVPNVQETVDYWTKYHHGRVIRSSSSSSSSSSSNNNGDDATATTLKGAFVVLGQQQNRQPQQQQPFALELTTFRGNQHKLSSSSSLSHSIAYIGVSLLAPPLLPPTLVGDAAAPTQAGTTDPNGICVRKVAAAPGDSFLSRFCLYSKTDSLDEMQDFYTSVVGMKCMAVDEKQLCLRFEKYNNNGGGAGGVPTTLVFENDKDQKKTSRMQQKNSCFDHLAIQVHGDIDEEYKRIQQQCHQDSCRLCLEMTEMFGNKLFGVLDPSGYKVIFFGQSSSASFQ
jgi:catechol 2,3-dioxygenase-like lactoylglutathione lyase family enzyme